MTTIVENQIDALIYNHFQKQVISKKQELRDIPIDSLDAVELMIAIEEFYGIEMLDREFNSWKTIEDIYQSTLKYV